MDFRNINRNGLSPELAFETFCTQLFERYILRNFESSLQKLRIVNGSGGDGGIEAYAEITNGQIKAIQAKWFLDSLGTREIGNIKRSIITAKKIRPGIKEYIVCIPHKIHSIKTGKHKRITKNPEEAKVDQLTCDIKILYPEMKLTWWFSDYLLTEVQKSDNDGVHKFWFEKEIITHTHLVSQFELQKENEWLKARYIPDLHGKGLINKDYQKLIFSREYREEVCNGLEEGINKLSKCCDLIKEFRLAKGFGKELDKKMLTTLRNFQNLSDNYKYIKHEIATGNSLFVATNFQSIKIFEIIKALDNHRPIDRQKWILPSLKKSLFVIASREIVNQSTKISAITQKKVKFVKGDFGTGKTHGLADCVETHLTSGAPAIIIQAKGTPCKNWTEILSSSLELTGWDKNQILSALETLAVRHDNLLAAQLEAGSELKQELSKALICVDGLEEDIEKESDWINRIRESVKLSKQYPRICFLFTARNYFNKGIPIITNKSYDEIILPREGDVPVGTVAENYLTHYGIQVPDASIIASIDNLLALRLFCEEYKTRILTKEDTIVTKTKGLLDLKVERINEEFINTYLPQKVIGEQPVISALLVTAKYFFSNSEIQHNPLKELIYSEVNNVLNGAQTDCLIEFLCNNGILIRIDRIDHSQALRQKKVFYRITYQSIVEHIIAEQLYHDLKNEHLKNIPIALHGNYTWELTTGSDIFSPLRPPETTNHEIIKTTVTRLFIETNQLIGDNGFLTEGFLKDAITEMRFTALREAPHSKAVKYKEEIDSFFWGGPKPQFLVLKYLIIPSCDALDTAFGAEYLHDILIKQPSAFERDKLWSGIDSFELLQHKNEENADLFGRTLRYAFGGDMPGAHYLSPLQSYNQKPLLFAWALTTIDQELREDLRLSLAEWSIKRPEEFLKLLNKIFFCNDPQIQEDLASIALAVASQNNDKMPILALSDWAIKNIFGNKDQYRNVIVRQGFRAIVEKAYILGEVSLKQVQKCRPNRNSQVNLLPLDKAALRNGQEQIYPIVHDLAWYVIENSYEKFLEFPDKSGNTIKDNNCKEAKKLLKHYRNKYSNKHIHAHEWAISAAIAYIKETLGLNRLKGNGWTEESHGGKSKLFTYEEKYTWLAVHYLQGYLSDYIPLKKIIGKRTWVKDYNQLTDIPNPGEMIVHYKRKPWEIQPNWKVPEDFIKTITGTGKLENRIKKWVNEEPHLEFSKWLLFNTGDFSISDENKKWTAIYNNTGLYDSTDVVYGSITATAFLIQKVEIPHLKKLVAKDADSLHFVTDLKHAFAHPDTETYSNPTDIVWMEWIEEIGSTEEFFYNSRRKGQLFNTITQVTQSTTKGEAYFQIPSKKLRKILGICSFIDNQFLDQGGQVLSFSHNEKDVPTKDYQRILLVDTEKLQKSLIKNQFEIVWFVEVFKKKNSLNKALNQEKHSMKTRKYLVYPERKKLKSIKFWDAYFSNRRDSNKKLNKSVPIGTQS